MSTLAWQPKKSFKDAQRTSKENPNEATSIDSAEVYEFGAFRLNANDRSLHRGDSPVFLPPKAFDLLLLMVRNPGRLLKKDFLLHSLWPDAVVEEANLSVYTSALRKAFRANPEDGEFIQTVPKWGYRFVGAVTVLLPEEPLTHGTAEDSANDNIDVPTSVPPVAARHRKWPLIALACGLAFAAALLAVRSPNPASSPDVRPLITSPGLFSQPAFSPDARRLAYAWRSSPNSRQDVFIQDIGSDDRVQLSKQWATGDSFSPAWSPDGRAVAYLHSAGDGKPIELWVSSLAANAAPRRLAAIEGYVSAFQSQPSLDWSPDGHWLLTSWRVNNSEATCVARIDARTGSKNCLTHPSHFDGDSGGKYSPDGRTIAFQRSLSSASDVYVMPAAGGPERRLTREAAAIDGLAWSPDGRSVLVCSGRATTTGRIWRVYLNGKDPVALTTPLAHVSTPSVSASTRRLVYVARITDTNIWRMELDRPAPAEPLIASTFLDSSADYSPDGQRVAFRSDRSGANEIWTANSDGTHTKQLTSFNGPMTGAPRWSPDGAWLAFDSRIAGNADIYVMRATGGRIIRVTSDPSDEVVPTWSHDGKQIYFSSSRSGSWQIWRASASGGPAVQLTFDGGFNAMESADGRDLYYVHDTSNTAIWRMPASGGVGTPVISGLGAGMWGSWTLTGNRLYYLLRAPVGDPARILMRDLATGRVQELGATQYMPATGDKVLAVSPNQQWLLYAQRDLSRSSVMLADLYE